MAIYGSDAFAYTTGQVLEGQNADWARDSSVALVTANGRVRGPGSTTTAAYRRTDIAPPSADYEVEADAYIVSTSLNHRMGVIARATGLGTGYWLSISGSGTVAIGKGTFGSAALVAAAVTTVAGQTYRLRLSVIGNVVRGYVDGVLIAAAYDDEYAATGNAGIGSIQSSAFSDAVGPHLDNFSVQSPTVSPTPTRLYLTDTAFSGVALTTRGTWAATITGGAIDRAMSPGKAGTATEANQTNFSSSANGTLVYRFASDPLAAQDVAGAVTWVIAARVTSSTPNAAFRNHGYVVAPDGSVRGVLWATTSDAAAGNEFPLTTAAGQGTDTGRSTARVAAQQGDRVVIEVGLQNTGGAANAGIWRGGTDATDLTAGDTTTTRPGWFEFSEGLRFGSPSVRAWILE